jgi:hypothetical protein
MPKYLRSQTGKVSHSRSVDYETSPSPSAGDPPLARLLQHSPKVVTSRIVGGLLQLSSDFRLTLCTALWVSLVQAFLIVWQFCL